MVRHALLFCTPSPRAFGVRKATLERALMAMVGLSSRTASSCTRTPLGTVALAPIASSANEDCYAASSAEKAADGIVHCRSSNNRRTHRQACVPRARLGIRSYSLRCVRARHSGQLAYSGNRCRARSLRSFPTEVPSPTPRLPVIRHCTKKSQAEEPAMKVARLVFAAE